MLAGNFRGTIGFALGDAPHQVNDAALCDHFESVDVQVFGIQQGCLDAAGEPGIVGALRQGGIALHRQFIDHRFHILLAA